MNQLYNTIKQKGVYKMEPKSIPDYLPHIINDKKNIFTPGVFFDFYYNYYDEALCAKYLKENPKLIEEIPLQDRKHW
jgi:hypothetical protein